jgi:predicted GNAT family acetyltransferase
VRFELTRDPLEFAERAGALLEHRIEHSLHTSVLADVFEGVYDESVFAYGVATGGAEVRFAAIRTPPWPMLVTELAAGQAAEFIARWLEQDPAPAGVTGPAPTARAVAAAWSELTGGMSRCHMREVMHALREVRDPARPASGRLRLAEARERELLVSWMDAFMVDAGLITRRSTADFVKSGLARESLHLWDRDGPVSLVGLAGRAGRVARIGPVYTPPAHRRRGYAGTAVAALSRCALEGGAQACMLFTDLANPTSNKIYAEVGYRPVGDWEEHVFEPR